MADSGYAIIGFLERSRATKNDVRVVRTKAKGDTLWTMTPGAPPIDCGRRIRRTSGSNFIVVGELDRGWYRVQWLRPAVPAGCTSVN